MTTASRQALSDAPSSVTRVTSALASAQVTALRLVDGDPERVAAGLHVETTTA